MLLSLEHLQTYFAAALAGEATPPQLSGALVEGTDRIALYRRNMRATWRQALANAYPVVRALIGEECFSDAARAYGKTHPSISGNLNTFGGRFAEFIAAWPVTRMLAYIGDIASLEWAIHRTHYAADARPLQRERITALTPNQLLRSRFAVHPACAWLASAHPVCSIWIAHRESGKFDFPPEPEFALVTRRSWDVTVTRVTRGEFVALDALRAGADMDETIATALRADSAFDFGKAFVRWLNGNVLIGFDEAPARR